MLKIIIALWLFPQTTQSNIYEQVTISKYGEQVITSALRHKVPPSIALAVCYQESRCGIKGEDGACYKCSKGNCGCMQVNFSTWKNHPILRSKIKVKEDLYGIDGVEIGVEILSRYYTRKKHKKYWVGYYRDGEVLKDTGISYAKAIEANAKIFKEILERQELVQEIDIIWNKN